MANNVEFYDFLRIEIGLAFSRRREFLIESWLKAHTFNVGEESWARLIQSCNDAQIATYKII